MARATTSSPSIVGGTEDFAEACCSSRTMFVNLNFEYKGNISLERPASPVGLAMTAPGGPRKISGAVLGCAGRSRLPKGITKLNEIVRPRSG